jgi:glycosyltransferase involved in cell wall biosynthesis
MILNLQTSTFSVYGGIPTYNQLVCRALNGFSEVGEKHVLSVTDKPTDIERRATELPNLQISAYAGNRRAFVKRVISLAINNRIDLALIGHVNYAPLGLLLRHLQPELRFGVMMYGIDVWTRLSPFRRRALLNADFTISISEYTRKRADDANGVMSNRSYLLPNALELYPKESVAISNRIALPKGTRLLTVCRLDATEKYKGVDTVIEALPSLIARVPDAQYLIIGRGSDTARLKKLAERIGVSERVHFIGSVDDATLRACYRACDVFVMPSAKEGFGFVFLEAMQYAKPVVAADSGGSPEVVRDGVTGMLVQYGDIPQLARALTDLCLNPERRAVLGRAGYQRLTEHFTFPKFKRTFDDILSREMPAAAIYRSRSQALGDVVRAV